MVAILSLSPSQTILEPFTPACPSVIRTASLPARGSNSLSFLSLQVFIHLSVCRRKYAERNKSGDVRTVANVVPTEFQAMLWIESPCPLSTSLGSSAPEEMSQRRTRWSPEAAVRRLEEVGWKITCPTLLLRYTYEHVKYWGDQRDGDVPTGSAEFERGVKVFRFPMIFAPSFKCRVFNLPDEY